MSEVNLGKAKGAIEIDATDAVKGSKTAEKAVDGFTQSLNKHSQTLQNVGLGFAAVATAGVAGFGAIVNSAADFESSLNGIQAVSGATAEEIDALSDKALQLGADTAFSAGQSAQAMEELIKAGLTTEDVLNGAADATVNLALAGQVDLPKAAEIASAAMNQFGLKAQELPGVADLIAGAANASAISVEDFAQSLQQSGGVANLAGFKFDDLAVAIAEMGKEGYKGSDAGTSLKTMFLNLNPSTEKQIALAKQLGILTKDGKNQFYDAAGSVKSYGEVSQVLQNSLAGLTDQQKTVALETLFGTDAIRAAATASKYGAAGFSEISEAMGKVQAADVAATRMKGLNGAIENLRGSVETAAITFGTPLLESITKVVDKVVELVNKFTELDDTTQKVILAVAGFGTVLVGTFGSMLLAASMIMKMVQAYRDLLDVMKLLKVFEAWAKVTKAVTAAQTLLNTALFANPIGLIVLAVAALIGGLILLYKHSDSFRKIVDSMWQGIQKAWDAILNFFKGIPDMAENAVNWVKKNWDILLAILTGPVGIAILIWRRFGDQIKEFVGNAITGVVGFFQSLPAKIGAAITAALAWFAQLPGKVFDFLVATIANILVFGTTMLGHMIRIGIDTVTALVNFFMELPGKIWNFLNAAFDFFVAFQRMMVEKAIEIGTNVVTSLITFFSELPGKIWSFLVNAYNFAVEFAKNMAAKAREAGLNFLNNVVQFIKDLPETIRRIASDALNWVINFSRDMATKAVEIGKGFFDTVTGFVKDLPGEIKKILDNMIEEIKKAAERAFKALKDLSGRMWEGFKKGLDMHSPSNIERAMFQIVDSVDASISELKDQVDTLQNVGGSLGDIDVGGSNVPLAPDLAATGTDGGVTLSFTFNGVTAGDIPAIRSAMTSSDVLVKITQAAKAGRRR